MSLVKCVQCCAELYIPCCSVEPVINGICPPCLLISHISGAESCFICHESISQSLFHFKNQIIRKKNHSTIAFCNDKLPQSAMKNMNIRDERIMSNLKKTNSYLQDIQSTPMKFNQPQTFNTLTLSKKQINYRPMSKYSTMSESSLDQISVTEGEMKAANEAMEIPLKTTVQTQLQKERQKNGRSMFFDPKQPSKKPVQLDQISSYSFEDRDSELVDY